MNSYDKDQGMSLVEKYFRVESMLHRYRYFARKQHGRMADPHRGQGRVLALLKMQPEISQRELGYLLGMRNQSLGELLAKLERSGYVTRTPSEKDRRVMDVHLTPEGEAAAQSMESQQDGVEMPFDFLSEEEQTQLSAILDHIIEALTEKMGEEDMEDDRFDPRRPGFGPHGRGFEGWEGRGPGPGRGRGGRMRMPHGGPDCPPCGPHGFHGPHHGPGPGMPPDFGWDEEPEGEME